MNIAEILQGSDVNRPLETLDAKILEGHIKTKVISIKDRLKPWITRPL